MSDPIATNESFEIKRVQMMAAAAMSAFMHQLGGIYPPRTGSAWNPNHFAHFLNGDRWRKDDQIIDFHHDGHDHRKIRVRAFQRRVLRAGKRLRGRDAPAIAECGS